MLTKYVRRGHVVFMFVASDGALGGDGEVRRQEQKDAARILGVREVFWGGYHDAEVLDVKLASLEAHRSQVSKTNIEDLTILELARSCANFRGIQARVKYAEAFQSVRLLLNL